MIVVSDSSPLIALAKIDCFALLQKLYGQIVISSKDEDFLYLASQSKVKIRHRVVDVTSPAGTVKSVARHGSAGLGLRRWKSRRDGRHGFHQEECAVP